RRSSVVLGFRGCVRKPTLTRETPMTTRTAVGPLRRSLAGARAVGAALTYTTTGDTTESRDHGNPEEGFSAAC
ncbi:MAG: hypothetical protein ACK5XB_12765, partial [Rhodospirillales bacterium]